MKLTESRLRNIIREEIQDLAEDRYSPDMKASRVVAEVEQFLSRRGEERRPATYTYKGYRFNTDRMGEMTAFVSMEPASVDPIAAESVGSATIEDDGAVIFGNKVQPEAQYTGPEDLIEAMLRRFGSVN